MIRIVFAVLVCMLSVTSVYAEELSYYPPGELFPGSGEGRKDDRKLYIPNMAFPLVVGISSGAHAYAGSQINDVKGGGANASENYHYPWRDVYCETRSWDMPLCPAGKGHQGVDIRPSSHDNAFWPAVAMADGIVTNVTSNTTVTVRSPEGYYCRYLHMSSQSIKDAGIKAGTHVVKGVTILGKISNIMGGTANTSIHLHFDCNRRIGNQSVFVPVYTSLVSAYRKAWELASVDENGFLGIDTSKEIGSMDVGGGSDCPAAGDSIGTESKYKFGSLWIHHCSTMGLEVDGAKRRLVYFKPKSALIHLVENEPVLFDGAYDQGAYSGSAVSYSSKCGPVSFAVSGLVSSDFRSITLRGNQPVRNDSCALVGTKAVELPFAYVSNYPPTENGDENEAPPVDVGSEAGPDIGALLFKNVLDYSFPKMAAKWSNKKIPVCWENPTAASDEDRALIESAAEDTWDRYSGIDFTGWQPCVQNNKGIRIKIEDSGPHTKGLGNALDGKPNGMVLNTRFHGWSPACAISEEKRRSCVYSIAVHEFGHAIAFAHEQNRPDTPGECEQPPQGGDGDNTSLTPYDPESVMNYCNSKYNNNGRLSLWDKYAVQYIYGGS